MAFERTYQIAARSVAAQPGPRLPTLVQDVSALHAQQAEHRRKNDFVAIVCEGIDPTLLPHLFDLFGQGLGRHGRMGIGLHLVKAIVQQHRGTVEARSAGLGCGCVFIVHCP